MYGTLEQQESTKCYFLQKKHFVYLSVFDPTQEIQCSYNEEKNISVWNSGGRKKVGKTKVTSKRSVLNFCIAY